MSFARTISRDAIVLPCKQWQHSSPDCLRLIRDQWHRNTTVLVAGNRKCPTLTPVFSWEILSTASPAADGAASVGPHKSQNRLAPLLEPGSAFSIPGTQLLHEQLEEPAIFLIRRGLRGISISETSLFPIFLRLTSLFHMNCADDLSWAAFCFWYPTRHQCTGAIACRVVLVDTRT